MKQTNKTGQELKGEIEAIKELKKKTGNAENGKSG